MGNGRASRRGQIFQKIVKSRSGKIPAEAAQLRDLHGPAQGACASQNVSAQPFGRFPPVPPVRPVCIEAFSNPLECPLRNAGCGRFRKPLFERPAQLPERNLSIRSRIEPQFHMPFIDGPYPDVEIADQHSVVKQRPGQPPRQIGTENFTQQSASGFEKIVLNRLSQRDGPAPDKAKIRLLETEQPFRRPFQMQTRQTVPHRLAEIGKSCPCHGQMHHFRRNVTDNDQKGPIGPVRGRMQSPSGKEIEIAYFFRSPDHRNRERRPRIEKGLHLPCDAQIRMHRHAQLAFAQDDVAFLGGKPFG